MKTLSLKEISETIKVEFIRIGFNPETEQTKFIAKIGEETFDFHCGLFACIPERVEREKGSLLGKYKYPLKALESRYAMGSNGNYQKEQAFKLIRQGQLKALKNWNNEDIRAVFEDISKLCSPTAYDLLYCLKSDSDAENMSFQDWCSNFGYDTDSRKALDIYGLCQQGAKKLRQAIGAEKFKQLIEAQYE